MTDERAMPEPTSQPGSEAMPSGLSCAEVSELAPAFVVGALGEAEMALVRAHLVTCPEAHAEFAELGSVVPALARAVPTAIPSAELGSRILAAARAEAATRPSPAIGEAATAAIPAPLTAASDRRAAGPSVPAVEPAGRRWSGLLDALRRPAWATAAVAAVLAIAVLGWNLQLQGQVTDLATYRNAVAAVVGAATASGTQPVVLAPGNGSAGPTGLAAFDASGRLLIAMHDLAPTSGSQVYEAWVIGSDGKPVPAGSFAVGSSGLGTLTATVGDFQAFDVVALTREPGPGATTPTLPILVQGATHSTSG